MWKPEIIRGTGSCQDILWSFYTFLPRTGSASSASPTVEACCSVLTGQRIRAFIYQSHPGSSTSQLPSAQLIRPGPLMLLLLLENSLGAADSLQTGLNGGPAYEPLLPKPLLGHQKVSVLIAVITSLGWPSELTSLPLDTQVSMPVWTPPCNMLTLGKHAGKAVESKAADNFWRRKQAVSKKCLPSACGYQTLITMTSTSNLKAIDHDMPIICPVIYCHWHQEAHI